MGVLKAKRNGQLVAYRLDKAAVIVGSGESCNIRVPDAGLVTRHCQILKMENGYVLRDMSGEVGTFVNGKKVKEHLLTDRDLIQVGKERFTFSEAAGENTSRVAVSVAPAAAAPTGKTTRNVAAAPAASRNTDRIATDPTRKDRGTSRISAPPPPAAEQPAGRSTGRVSKGTGVIKKPTERAVTGGTKKITARTAAGMGYQTSRSTFAMPSTKKGKFIAIGAVAFIALLGGVMYLIKSSQIDPEKVKETMFKQMKDVNAKYKPDQPIEIDAALEAILNEHEPVKKYVAQMYANIEKEHTKVHQIASDLKKANKDVLPFFAKVEQLKKKPEDLKAQAQKIYDEGKSLKDSYGLTVHGDKLQAILDELMKILGDRGPSWEEKLVPFQGEVRAAAKKGDFVGASKKCDEFGETFKEKENLQVLNKVNEQREFLTRESKAFVNREIAQAKKDLAAEGAKKDEIKKKLEGHKAGLEGYKEALENLEKFILTVK